MAAANTAHVLADLVRGYVVQPIAQTFLPSFLRRALSVQSPHPETADIPFRIDFRPTPTCPQDVARKEFFEGIRRAINTKSISSVPENLPAVALDIMPMTPTNVYGIPVASSATSTADFTQPATHTFSPPDYVARSTPKGEWSTTLVSALTVFLVCALVMMLLTYGYTIYQYVKGDIDAHELDEIKDTLSSTLSPFTNFATYAKRALFSDIELEKKFEAAQAQLSQANEAYRQQKKRADKRKTEADEVASKSAKETSKLKNDLDAATKAKDEAIKQASNHEITKKHLGESMVETERAKKLTTKAAQRAKDAEKAKNDAEKEARKLHTEIEIWKEKCNESQAAEKALSGQVKYLSGKLKQSEGEMRSAEECATQKALKLEEKLEGATQKTRDLEQKLDDANKLISRLQVESGKLEGRCKNLTSELQSEKIAKDQCKAQQLDSLKQKLAGAEEQISKLRSEKMHTEARCESLKDDLEYAKNARAEDDAKHEEHFDQFCAAARARSAELSADIDSLIDENEKLQSQLNKACRCKRGRSSNGSDEDDDDENDDLNPKDDHATGNDDGAATDTMEGEPKSDGQLDGGAPSDKPSDSNCESGDPESGPRPDDTITPTGNSSTDTTEPLLKPVEQDDGSTPRDQLRTADTTAGDLKSTDQGEGGIPQAVDPIAKSAASGEPSTAGNDSVTDGQQPGDGNGHPGPTRNRPPGFYNMTKTYQRQYQRYFAKLRAQTGNDQQTHAQLAYFLAQHQLPLSQPTQSQGQS